MAGRLNISKIDEKSDNRTFWVFQRLQRFYKLFIVFSALVGGLCLVALRFDEFHPTRTSLLRAAEGFLFSSLITAVFSVMVTTMLLFYFEGHESANSVDLALAWTPVVLLDWVILACVLGLGLWYSGKNKLWRSATMSAQLGGLLLVSVSLAVWMWNSMSKEGGLGKEKGRPARDGSEEADK